MLGYFGVFFNYNFNSSKQFALDIKENNKLTEVEFPVGYFKKDFLRKIKGGYERIIIFGMSEFVKEPQFEIIARDQVIKLKNPILRLFGNLYFYILKLLGLNPRTSMKETTLLRLYKKLFRKSSIEKNLKDIQLKTKTSTIFKKSKNAGEYVCNYVMWIIERFLRENNLKTEFYFIHLPKYLSETDKTKLEKFIYNY